MAGQYELNLRDYWRILRRRKMIVIFTTGMVTVFSFLVLEAQNRREIPQYRATAKIQIEKKSSLSDVYLQMLTYGEGDDLTSRQMVIKSNAVMERVAKKLGMLPDSVDADLIAKTQGYIRVLNGLKSQVSTGVEGYTNIITISVTDRDRHRARDIANAVAQMYKEYNSEEKNRQLREGFDYVEAQRDSVKRELDRAAERLKNYRIQNRLTSIDAQISDALRRSTEKEQSLQGVSEHLEELDKMLSELESTGALSDKTMESLVFEATGGVISSLSDQLASLNRDREALLRTYTESHPEVKALDARIEDTRRSLVSQLRIRRNVLRRQREVTTAELDSLKSVYESLPKKGLTQADLEYEVKTRQELLAMLEEEYQKALIKRKYEEVEEVRIIQQAFSGSRINRPSSRVRSLVGAVIGIMLGFVFAFVLETLDTSIGAIEDVEEYVGTSVVGLIPHTFPDDIKDSLIERGIEWDESFLERSPRLISYLDPQSSLAESYRQLRTNIQFLVMDKGIKTIAVTSSSRGEGKTSATCNLALTMAQLGTRVLLVDCDLRKPSVARTFRVDREPGLTDVILGNYELEDVVKTVHDIMVGIGSIGLDDTMMSTGVENLNIFTSGILPPNAAELINSTRMQELIGQFREEYDLVFFDTPPVLEATDARILATKVDGTLLVYKVGEVARSRLKRMKLLLDSVNAPILGIVLNGLRAEVSSDFQDMRYYSYYSYGHEREDRSWWRRLGNRGIRTAKALFRRGKRVEERQEAFEEEVADEEVELSERSWIADALTRLGALFGGGEARRGWYKRLALGVSSTFVIAGFIWQMEWISPGGLRGTTRIPESRKTRRTVNSSSGPVSSEATETKAKEERDELSTSFSGTGRPDSASNIVVRASSLPGRVRRQTGVAREIPPEETLRDRVRAKPSAVVHRDESAGPSTRPFSVHVNSYTSSREAEEEVDRLLRAGYEAFAVPAYRGRIRVLVGSFGTKAEATSLADRLRQEGYADLAAVLRLPYTVRVSAFDSKDAAEAGRRRLREGGYFPYILVHTSGEDVSEYVVALGAFSSEAAAKHLSRRLNTSGMLCRVIAR